MENDPDVPEPAAAEPDKTGASVVRVCEAALKAASQLLPRLGLYLFMLAIPLAVISYPAYRLTAQLGAYPMAKIVDARLDNIDVQDVREPDRHFEIVFTFSAADGKTYSARLRKSWPSPGLQRKMDARYRDGDPFTLHLTPDGAVIMEEELAKDTFLTLTALMALIFIATLLYFMLRHRLAHRMPNVLPAASMATTKSIILGQLITLAVAALFLIVMEYSPLLIPIPLYFGAYFGIAVTLCLSLRLLLFEDRKPAPAQNPLAELIRKAR